jgi:hypothetical protein
MELIGKKVKGFKFDKNHSTVTYMARSMDKYIGQVGIITDQCSTDITIKFDDGKSWCYPIEEVKDHLLDILEEIPVITQGIILEVSDDEETWFKAEVIIVLNEVFITKDLIQWKYARNIQENEKKTV